MMTVSKLRSVDAAIRTLSGADRRRVLDLIQALQNWDDDDHLKQVSKPTIYNDLYALDTLYDIRIFFTLDEASRTISILDIAKPSRFKNAIVV